VLVANIDPITLKATSALLGDSGVIFHEARSGAEALAIARRTSIELAVLNLEWSDISAIDVLATLRSESITIPWILMHAMHALRIEFERDACRERSAWPRPPMRNLLIEKKTTIRRAACLLLRACDSSDDLPTIGHWAEFVAVSNTQLRDTYSRLRISTHDARDFMRVFRALSRRRGNCLSICEELDIRDYRTAAALLVRAGLAARDHRVLSPIEFISRQRFIDPSHSLVREVVMLLADLRLPECSTSTQGGCP
jgi:CheY-like chemotaxis protein